MKRLPLRFATLLLPLLFTALPLPAGAQDEEKDDAKTEEPKKDDPSFRVFHSKNGKTLKAKVLNRIDDERYQVETPDGKTFTLNTSTLSERDAFYLDAWEPGGIIDIESAKLSEILAKKGYSTAELSTNGASYLAPVKINGESLRFVIAPDRTFSVLDPAVAKTLGLTLSPGNLTINKPGGESETANQGTVDSFTVGEVELKSETLIVFAVTGFVRDAGNADGLIGLELLKKLNALVDYGGKQLFVRSGDSE